MATLYEAFGLPENCSSVEIKQRYRDLARRYHPDLHPQNPAAEEMFKKVAEIYEVLGNEKERSHYNQGLKWKRQQAARSATYIKAPVKQGSASLHNYKRSGPHPEKPLFTRNLKIGIFRALAFLTILISVVVTISLLTDSGTRTETLYIQEPLMEINIDTMGPGKTWPARKQTDTLRKWPSTQQTF